MASPCIWAWNDSHNFSGFSWPGDQLAELVGTSPDGNAIYRWVSHETGQSPTSLIFSDGGANATSQMTFVNGGYYTPDGLVGTVNSNVTSLAGLIKSGDTSREFIISNDLTLVHAADDQNVWVKDLDGDAIAPSAIKSTQQYYPGTTEFNRQRNGDFDQSNWAQLILPEGISANELNTLLLGQTVIGRLSDAVNPTIQLSVMPIFGKKLSPYVPNTYIPSNFVKQPTYFFVTPKPQEYANVVWAVYVRPDGENRHVFAVPEKQQRGTTVVNAQDLSGALYVTIDNAICQKPASFSVGELYELTGIIKKTSNGNGNSAPRHITPKDGEPSGNLALSLVNWNYEGTLVVTAVDDLTQTTSRQVASVKYVNMAGLQSDRPFQGVNIRVTRYTDGSTATTKVIH